MKRKITVPLSGITCLALLSLVGCFDDAQEDREGSRAGVKPRGGEPTVAEKARRGAPRRGCRWTQITNRWGPPT